MASRPKTLIASVAPLLVAAQNFFKDHAFNQTSFLILLGCFLFMSLLQISTNLANDYFDCKKGADDNRENAPERYVSSGKIEEKQILGVVCGMLILAFFVGLITLIFSSASLWFLPLGIVCISLCLLYTGGPYPLAYNGLGDLFVILFYGFVAVEGTNFFLCSVNSVKYSPNLGSALSVGLIINNLLVVNNYRDCESDAKVGKKTSIVLFGKKFGILLFLVGFLVPVIHGYISGNFLVFSISITSGISLFFIYRSNQLKYANLALSFSALSVLVYAICWLFN